MRIPIFAAGANPRVSPRIAKQSLAYSEEQVRLGWLKWVDPSDKSKGAMRTRRLTEDLVNSKDVVVAGSITNAWQVRESGLGGPLVLQLVRQ